MAAYQPPAGFARRAPAFWAQVARPARAEHQPVDRACWVWQGRVDDDGYAVISESRGRPVGHEYQMIDDSLVSDPKGSTAAFYDVLSPNPSKKPPKINDWNFSRVLVAGNHVEHWLNGDKVLAYELGSPTVLSAVRHSKFSDIPGFGTKIEGHILLTDHGDEARYRNIKIRPLGG